MPSFRFVVFLSPLVWLSSMHHGRVLLSLYALLQSPRVSMPFVISPHLPLALSADLVGNEQAASVH